MARIAPETRAKRMIETEELMVRGLTARKVRRTLAERWGVSEQTAMKYMSAVRKAWAEEVKGLDRTERRNEHRAKLTKIFERALMKRATVRDGQGNPVIHGGTLVQDENGRTVLHGGQLQTIEAADLRSALRALAQVAKLDNLNDETFKTDGHDQLVDLMKLGMVAASKKPGKGKGNGKANGSNGANGHG